ncbi:glycosyltransferase [Pseudomonas sp. AR5]|nr:glycosyltransferase [Pseudomonas sp. AR5]
MRPILSVAIPTHNRSQYAISSIKSILSIDDPRLQLVVSDTSTDGKLRALLENASLMLDSRFKYLHHNVKLDMTGNHNAAISAAEGEYVCLIGDDDTVSKECIEAVEWALGNNVEIISPNVVSNYVWPDFKHRFFGSGHASRLYFSKKMGAFEVRESKTALLNALSNAAQGTDGLPKIYHGLVKRSLLERIYHLSGAYFHGSSPDVSGAVGLALVSKNFLVIDYPLTVPGAAGGSNTGRSAMNTHKGKLDKEEQTKGFGAGGWSLGVPRFFSVETVWAHAALETLKKIDPDKVESFNFARLIGICRVMHPDYIFEIDGAQSEIQQNLVDSDFERQVSVEYKGYRRSRLIGLLKRAMTPTVSGGRPFVSDINSVAEVPEALYSYLKVRGLSWGAVINSADISLG